MPSQLGLRASQDYEDPNTILASLDPQFQNLIWQIDEMGASFLLSDAQVGHRGA